PARGFAFRRKTNSADLCATLLSNHCARRRILRRVELNTLVFHRARKIMGYFALFYETVDDFVNRRLPYRDDSVKPARDTRDRGDLVMAGALAQPDDGALLVFRGDQPDAAENFARHDPYVINGLVVRWHVRPWTVVVGNESATSTTAS